MYTVDKNSWHYKLAITGKDAWELEWFEEECDNFCKYARSVLNGFMRYAVVALGLTTLFGVSVYCLGDFIGWIIWMLTNMAFVEPWLGASIILVAAFLIIGLLVFAVISKMYNKVKLAIHHASRNITTSLEKKESGFIAALYKKYKQKVCFGVDYTEVDNG